MMMQSYVTLLYMLKRNIEKGGGNGNLKYINQQYLKGCRVEFDRMHFIMHFLHPLRGLKGLKL